MSDKEFVVMLLCGVPVFFLIYFIIYWWFDAICNGCRRRSPDFVWSYGHASKTYCERCDKNRIKEVFGSNLLYLEHKAKKHERRFNLPFTKTR